MRQIRTVILMMLTIMLTHVVSAEGVFNPFEFKVQVFPVIDKEVPDKDPIVGHRIPGKMISATIGESGRVEIIGVDPEDISEYAILNVDEEIIGVFADGFSFSHTLFSLKGEYELRFTTSEYVYIGYVWVE